MTRKSEAVERYLKIPYHILNLEQIGLCEKVLLAHIYSFGRKGCYESNSTLADFFMVKERTIRRWIQKLVRANLVQIKSSKGYYRTIWARSHPEVKEAAELYYRGRKMDNNGQQPDQKPSVDLAKSGLRPGQKCPTTNNNTIKETIEVTTATPSPLPAGGQAPALLEDRKAGKTEAIEKFKRDFGMGRKPYHPMPENDFNDKRNRQLAALGV